MSQRYHNHQPQWLIWCVITTAAWHGIANTSFSERPALPVKANANCTPAFQPTQIAMYHSPCTKQHKSKTTYLRQLKTNVPIINFSIRTWWSRTNAKQSRQKPNATEYSSSSNQEEWLGKKVRIMLINKEEGFLIFKKQKITWLRKVHFYLV